MKEYQQIRLSLFSAISMLIGYQGENREGTRCKRQSHYNMVLDIIRCLGWPDAPMPEAITTVHPFILDTMGLYSFDCSPNNHEITL